MTRRCCLLLLAGLCLLPLLMYGQQENIWTYGRGIGLNFNSGSPVYEPINIDARECAASVCDEQGQLVFYTEGYNVWSKNGQLMPNGQKILGTNFTFNPTSSTRQGALIVPMPDSPQKYYVFSLTCFEVNPAGTANKLYYSIVNMELNGGLGDVEPARKGILVDSQLTEMMTAVVGDRCNVWLLVNHHFSNTFRAFSITAAGIDLKPVVSELLWANYGPFQPELSVAPDRKKVAIGRNGLGLYDFDPATGALTGKISLILNEIPQAGGPSTAFSADSRKLYASDKGKLYQYDLSSEDSLTIINSKFLVVTPESMLRSLKRGPDSRIYYGSPAEQKELGIVEYPNLPGAACQFILDKSIIPADKTGGGFPNVVPVFRRDTSLTAEFISAGCWANVRLLMLQVQDTAGWDYVWNTGVTGTSRNVDAPGTYWVSYYTAPCTYHTDTFKVIFPNGILPDLHIQGSCKGSENGKVRASTYPGDTVRYHYTWMTSTLDTLSQTDTLVNVPSGTYQVRIRTEHCDTLLSFFIPSEDFRVSFKADTLVCAGTPLQLHNTSDPHFTTYFWDFGTGATSTLPDPIYTYNQAGQFELRLIGQGPICTDTTYQVMIVDAVAKDLSLEKDRQSLCIGETVHFHPKTDSTARNLVWDFGAGNVTSAGAEAIQHAYDQAGHFTIQLTAHFRVCPELIIRDSIVVTPLPEVILNRDSSLCYKGHPILLYNHGSMAAGDQYLWQDGSRDSLFIVKHPGRYSLTLTNSAGCSTTEYTEVLKDCYTDIPNAFSPDGDGINDYFFPRQLLSSDAAAIRFQVFNRWGRIVFRTTSKDGRGWDGRLNGQDQPAGVYMYTIYITMTNGNEEKYRGNVTLLR